MAFLSDFGLDFLCLVLLDVLVVKHVGKPGKIGFILVTLTVTNSINQRVIVFVICILLEW